MLMMPRTVILTGWMLMTGSAKPVVFVLRFQRMGIVTIRTTNSLLEHLALQE